MRTFVEHYLILLFALALPIHKETTFVLLPVPQLLLLCGMSPIVFTSVSVSKAVLPMATIHLLFPQEELREFVAHHSPKRGGL